MKLSELLLKDSLSSGEKENLRQLCDSIEDAATLVGKWTNIEGLIRQNAIISQPFQTIYNKVLESDTSLVTVVVPSVFRTIVIYGSGSITTANGGNVWAQFNSDTGSNYTWQYIKGDGATVSGAQDTSDPYVALGVFGTTGAGAGVNGSFRAEIIHCQGAWKKNVLSHCYTAEFNDLYLLGSTWQNTATIKTIDIFATDNTLAKGSASIASGSLFTIYGAI